MFSMLQENDGLRCVLLKISIVAATTD